MALEQQTSTLRDELQRDDVELLDQLRLLLAAGRELEAAHEAGAVHGDFEPSSVHIGADGVRVTGFGQPGTSTTAYAAPELFEGADADRTSDVYAFCVSLFELLYGALPFRGPSVRDLYNEKVWLVELPDRPALTPTLRRLLSNGLHPSPCSRPATLAPLLAELEVITRKRRLQHLHLVVPATIVALLAFSWM